jgi:hypothetical protein
LSGQRTRGLIGAGSSTDRKHRVRVSVTRTTGKPRNRGPSPVSVASSRSRVRHPLAHELVRTLTNPLETGSNASGIRVVGTTYRVRVSVTRTTGKPRNRGPSPVSVALSRSCVRHSDNWQVEKPGPVPSFCRVIAFACPSPGQLASRETGARPQFLSRAVVLSDQQRPLDGRVGADVIGSELIIGVRLADTGHIGASESSTGMPVPTSMAAVPRRHRLPT